MDEKYMITEEEELILSDIINADDHDEEDFWMVGLMRNVSNLKVGFGIQSTNTSFDSETRTMFANLEYKLTNLITYLKETDIK